MTQRIENKGGGPCGSKSGAAGTGCQKPSETRHRRGHATATSAPRQRPTALKPIKVCAQAFASILEVDRVTVWRWMGEGMPVLRRRGGEKGSHEIDLVAAVRWLRARDQVMHEEALANLRTTPEMEALRRRKLEAEARIAEANAAKVEGELVPAAEVEPRWSRMCLAMRERILSAAPVAVQRGLVSPESEAGLTEIMHDALSELATRGNGDAHAG